MGSEVREVYARARFWWKIFVLVGRFFSGRPLGGGRKTDATFFRPATRSLDPSGTALRWEMQRGAARLAWRLLFLYLISLVVIVLPVSKVLVSAGVSVPSPLEILWWHVSVSGVLLCLYVTQRGNVEHGYRLPYFGRFSVETVDAETGDGDVSVAWEWRWYVREGRLRWEQRYVLPLAKALSSMLNVSVTSPKKARQLISVPRDFRAAGGVRISLPAHFTGADEGVKKRISATVRSKLGLREELVSVWRLEGDRPDVVFNLPASPPAEISFTEMLPYYLRTSEFEFVHGVISGGEVFSTSLSGDSPHKAISAGSGAGKSTLLKAEIMQALHRGWNVIVLDWKEESQHWCRGLPGVRYCTSVEAIHDMLVQIGDEVEVRKARPGEPRRNIMLVAEEWSITAPLLKEYWDTLRSTAEPEERRTMPLRSPAISACMKVVFTGRALGIFETLVAIRFSARVTNGNADLRESFGVIFMARWKGQTVKMLAPDIKPFPKKITTPGRWVAVNGDEYQIFQAPLITDDEAREFAMQGTASPSSPWSVGRLSSDSPLADVLQSDDHGVLLGDRSAPPNHALEGSSGHLDYDAVAWDAEEVEGIDARKLSGMVEGLAHLSVTLDILRHGAKSDPEFPAAFGGSSNRGYTYDYRAVKEWARKRYAARKAEGGK